MKTATPAPTKESNRADKMPTITHQMGKNNAPACGYHGLDKDGYPDWAAANITCQDCLDKLRGLPPALASVIKKFLVYSLNPIKFDYTKLTDTEKGLCSPQEFVALVKWVKS